jgi:hypothetical protein
MRGLDFAYSAGQLSAFRYRNSTHHGHTHTMMTQRPRWSEPADTPEQQRPADARAQAKDKPVKAERDRDRKWPWPRTLRLAILISGAFWLLVAAGVWAYLRAG